jgi:hypothetical protein
MAQYGVSYPNAEDGHSDVSKQLYRIQGVPETFVIDKDGNIDKFFYSVSPDTTPSLDNLVVTTKQLGRIIDDLLAQP